LTPAERARLGLMTLAVAAVNAAGWGIFVLAIAPRHFHYRGLGVGLGVALTAWSLGARHGFDADHISAIDNTTRKLMADGCRPLGTGFFFALGHSASDSRTRTPGCTSGAVWSAPASPGRSST
jgi:high-affinity nickel-transport protein